MFQSINAGVQRAAKRSLAGNVVRASLTVGHSPYHAVVTAQQHATVAANLSIPKVLSTILPSQQRRLFHLTTTLNETAATPVVPNNAAAAAAGDAKTEEPKKKKEKNNIFLDNLGTIFLSAIGLLIASLVRSFYASTRKNALRERLEEIATLDPLEIDELRRVNPTLNVSVFRALVQQVWKRYPDGQMTYQEFMETVRGALVKEHRVPTVEFGHLLDRVALHNIELKGDDSTTPQSATLWMVILSLALNAPTPDRIQVLYEILQKEAEALQASPVVTVAKVQELIQFLQTTDQLALEKQLIPTKEKQYPVPHYHRGTAEELIEWEGATNDAIDVDALAAILRSQSICAWGECYHKKKFV
mmetsp:Transcript_10282/g.13590  ORF Transcript_10282/g.13590 Transcript_10282/m.13590 type:complete len:359 (-) Transcript_10282:104-1180(-)